MKLYNFQIIHLPLLAPMSEVAGRMATQIGAQFFKKQMEEKGFFLEEFQEYHVEK